MKCTKCSKNVPLSQGMFKENGKVEGMIMTRYDFLCKTCLQKKPIDDTALSRGEAKVSKGEAPF